MFLINNMNIFNIPPSGGEQPSSMNENRALLDVSKKGDQVLDQLEKVQTRISQLSACPESSDKFHDAVTRLVQKFADFQESVQKLVKENPKHSQALVDASHIYNFLIQPLVVSNHRDLPGEGEPQHIMECIEEAKRGMHQIFDHL